MLVYQRVFLHVFSPTKFSWDFIFSAQRIPLPNRALLVSYQGLSTYNTSSAALLTPKPKSWSFEEAAELMLNALDVGWILGAFSPASKI